MILTKEIFVVRQAFSTSVIWAEALFTKEEADKEVVIAQEKTGKQYEVINLDEHLTELRYTYY